ncbi:MAG TPA: hypothetical protein VG672_23510, partial [Bryobacteraceae bacterium]|nr:hypothetical protein [Bryobacteraceae bacterium]
SSWNAGDRVEIRFDYARSAASGSFQWEVRWGGVVASSGSSSGPAVTGRIDAALDENGAQLSWQAWGSALPLSTGVMNAGSEQPATIEFHASSGRLRNFTVIRYPRP